jgi:hypothetical protein
MARLHELYRRERNCQLLAQAAAAEEARERALAAERAREAREAHEKALAEATTEEFWLWTGVETSEMLLRQAALEAHWEAWVKAEAEAKDRAEALATMRRIRAENLATQIAFAADRRYAVAAAELRALTALAAEEVPLSVAVEGKEEEEEEEEEEPIQHSALDLLDLVWRLRGGGFSAEAIPFPDTDSEEEQAFSGFLPLYPQHTPPQESAATSPGVSSTLHPPSETSPSSASEPAAAQRAFTVSDPVLTLPFTTS